MTNNKSIEKLVENIFVKHNWVQRLGKDAVTGPVEIMEVMDDLISDLEAQLPDINNQWDIVASGEVEFSEWCNQYTVNSSLIDLDKYDKQKIRIGIRKI